MSDRVGRKLPLYVGLGLFAAASVGCALATVLTETRPAPMRAASGLRPALAA